MISLYFILILCSIAVPIVLSFDKKLHFYTEWKYLFPSILLVAAVYIAIDIAFTKAGIWGFNERYHSGIEFLHLPIEEWLFFIVIPYASIFLHDALVLYFPNFRIKKNQASILSAILLFLTFILLFFTYEKAYTTYILITVALVLSASFFDSSETTNSFYLTFLVILIPFLAVNAILTGSFIDEPIVWYNNSENLGIRFLTIPIEDFGYAFSLILFNLLLRATLKTVFKISK